jgi:hypothetical protein
VEDSSRRKEVAFSRMVMIFLNLKPRIDTSCMQGRLQAEIYQRMDHEAIGIRPTVSEGRIAILSDWK